MEKWTHSNIVDELCFRLKRSGPAELAKLLGVTRQTINGWKNRNKLPESFYPRINDLTGIAYEDLIAGPKGRATSVPMTEFLSDITRFVESARNGAAIVVTVNGKPVVQLTRP